MSENDKKASCLVALAANYGKEFPASLFAVWLDLLQDYDSLQVSQAVKEVIRAYEYKTIPPFAVLQKELDKVCNALSLEAGLEALANDEWENLLQTISVYGRYREAPEFCPTTAFVLRQMGGYDRAMNWRQSELDWKRKEFMASWQNAYGHVEQMLAMRAGKPGLLRANGQSSLWELRMQALEQ